LNAKVSVFIATSLDGYISRPDGSIDWLEEANRHVPKGEDCGYGAFIEGIDALIMGRRTFEQALTFNRWPYAKPVTVLTRSALHVPAPLAGKAVASSESPRALIERLSREGAKHVYVDGGLTIQSFLVAGLIDEITITVIPMLLGAGRALFGPLAEDLKLDHLSTKTYDFGFVQNRYRISTGRTP
jgi:dihydrofolate reductase